MSRKILLKEVLKKLRIVKSYMTDTDVVDIPLKQIVFTVTGDWIKTPNLVNPEEKSMFLVSYVDDVTAIVTTVIEANVLFEKEIHSDSTVVTAVNKGKLIDRVSGRIINPNECMVTEAGVIYQLETLEPTVFTSTIIFNN